MIFNCIFVLNFQYWWYFRCNEIVKQTKKDESNRYILRLNHDVRVAINIKKIYELYETQGTKLNCLNKCSIFVYFLCALEYTTANAKDKYSRNRFIILCLKWIKIKIIEDAKPHSVCFEFVFFSLFTHIYVRVCLCIR